MSLYHETVSRIARVALDTEDCGSDPEDVQVCLDEVWAIYATCGSAAQNGRLDENTARAMQAQLQDLEDILLAKLSE